MQTVAEHLRCTEYLSVIVCFNLALISMKFENKIKIPSMNVAYIFICGVIKAAGLVFFRSIFTVSLFFLSLKEICRLSDTLVYSALDGLLIFRCSD